MTDDELIEWLLDWGRIGEEPVLIEAASRIKKLRAALRNISEGDILRTAKTQFRDDEEPSKHDRCEHGHWMYEECACCVEDYARKVLEGKDE
jgi:hypothetical protein